IGASTYPVCSSPHDRNPEGECQVDDRTRNVSGSSTSVGTAPSEDARALEIRSDIERTREDLSETVDAIQEKLRPANVVASAASATTEKVKDMASQVADTAGDWWEG